MGQYIFLVRSIVSSHLCGRHSYSTPARSQYRYVVTKRVVVTLWQPKPSTEILVYGLHYKQWVLKKSAYAVNDREHSVGPSIIDLVGL